MTLVSIVGIIAVLIMMILCVSIIKEFKRLQVKVDKSISGLDMALIKRYDLLTKSLDSVKDYITYEDDTLIEIVDMQKPANNLPMIKRQEFDNKVAHACGRFNIFIDNYPHLKEDSEFSELQQDITDTEEHLQMVRKEFNVNVAKLNHQTDVFPKSLIATAMGVSKKSYYIVDESRKEDMKINI